VLNRFCATSLTHQRFAWINCIAEGPPRNVANALRAASSDIVAKHAVAACDTRENDSGLFEPQKLLSHQRSRLMTKSYEEVLAFVKENEAQWRTLATDIELEFVRARDQENIPIYLTKMRIKKAPSAYLKTKRKSKDDLNQITDWIGLRVLCLFQQDLGSVHRYLLRLFVGQETPAFGRASVKEIIVFNWEETLAKQQIENSIDDALRQPHIAFDSAADNANAKSYSYVLADKPEHHAFTYKTEQRGSGYKSVHYNVVLDGITIELQLRTLLQDVWGELEHALSYKMGKIHPHIRSSFQLLSRELEAKDTLVSQLRTISEKEKTFALYASIKSGPTKWLSYEPSFTRNLPQTPEFGKFLDDYYKNFTPDLNNRWTRNLEWCEKVAELISLGSNLVDVNDSPYLKFFFDMERAFVAFSRGDIAAAETIYRTYAVDDRSKDRWVVHLRLGEIQNVRGDIQAALVCFDRCESLLAQVSEDDRDHLGEFFAQQKLASVYWSLGEEYTDIALEKIHCAEKLYLEYLQGSPGVAKLSLLNNLCYFALEKFLTLSTSSNVSARFRAGIEADRRANALRQLIAESAGNNGATLSSNAYDTLAWHAFQKYKLEKDKPTSRKESLSWLKKSYTYMEAAESQPNTSSASPLTSIALQHDHLQEIMAAYDKEFRGPSL
jgi:ppGpp synthetase/RelA/SpoT-type nucleotidyltranferase